MPRRVIDVVRGDMGMFDGSWPPPYTASALMDFMRIEEGSLSSFADSQNCLNGVQYKARFTGYADCFNPSSKHNWDVPKTSFTCWFGGIQTVELPDEDNDSMWNVSSTPKIFLSNADMPRIAYPIAQELPYIQLPIGRNGTGKLEGLLDTGGCSTLGHLPYFMQLAISYPDLVVDVHELQQYRLENINISGVGQGAVVVTHIMEIHMPFVINGTQTKINIGLADNAPITLLYGLPFQTSAKMDIKFGSMTVYSPVFDATFRMTMKPPHRKHPDSVRYVQDGKTLSLPTILQQNRSLFSSEQRQPKRKRGNDDILPNQE
jgi:hypothetical protein